jgi:hypothetical protein
MSLCLPPISEAGAVHNPLLIQHSAHARRFFPDDVYPALVRLEFPRTDLLPVGMDSYFIPILTHLMPSTPGYHVTWPISLHSP